MFLAAALIVVPTTAAADGIHFPENHMVIADFDNDGELDAVYGNPAAGTGPLCPDTGEILIFYDMDAGFVTTSPDEVWDRDTSGVTGATDCGDYFGASLAAVDINGDDYDDLIVGVPGDSISSAHDAGSIHVFYGNSSGLSTTGDQIFSQDSSSVVGVAENGDWFGISVGAGDFDCDGYGDVVVGASHEDVGSISDAGYAVVLYGSSSGLSGTGSTGWHQDTTGVEGVAEAGDEFGAFITVANVDGDRVGGVDCDDIAIGAPGEGVGSIANAGSINLLFGDSTNGITATGDAIYHQNVSNVEGTAEVDDYFGSQLHAYDDDEDGYEDLVTFIPGEAIPGGGDGRNQILYGSSTGIDLSRDAIFDPVGSSNYTTAPVEDSVCWALCYLACRAVGKPKAECALACEDICYDLTSPDGGTCEPIPAC